MSDVKFAEVWGWVQLTAEEAVKLQMDALACNNEPRPDHGLEVHLNLCSHMSSGLRFIFIKQFTILEAWCIVIFKHRCVCIYICLRLWCDFLDIHDGKIQNPEPLPWSYYCRLCTILQMQREHWMEALSLVILDLHLICIILAILPSSSRLGELSSSST